MARDRDARIDSPSDIKDGGNFRVTGPSVVVTPPQTNRPADKPKTTWTQVGTVSQLPPDRIR
jgi:hypothetical protein